MGAARLHRTGGALVWDDALQAYRQVDRHTIDLAEPRDERRYLVKCYGNVIGQYLWTRVSHTYTCWSPDDSGVMYTIGQRPDARAAFDAILDTHDCDIDTIGGD